MSTVCDVTSGGKHELVISEDEPSKEAHQSLFRYRDEHYLLCKGDAFESLKDAIERGAIKVHLSGSWKWILAFATGQREPKRGDVFYLLKSCGVTEDELRPFRGADVEGIFHFLYYGKRFEVLRKVCHRAKNRTEQMLGKEGISIHCHIVSSVTSQIVASSL